MFFIFSFDNPQNACLSEVVSSFSTSPTPRYIMLKSHSAHMALTSHLSHSATRFIPEENITVLEKISHFAPRLDRQKKFG